MRERQGAVASGIAGIGLPSLTWGLDRMGVGIPYGVAVAISIVSALLIVFALVLAVHMLWYWVAANKATVQYYWAKGGKKYSKALGILLSGLLIGWLIGGHTYPFWHSSQNTGPIVWNFDETASGHAYFLNMQKAENKEINVVGFGAIGKNISPEPIDDFQGYLRSDITNETVPIYILAANAGAAHACTFLAPTLPSDTLGIPAFSMVQIVTYKKPYFVNVPYADALPLAKFKAEFVPFTVALKYGGKEYKRQFSREEVERQQAIIEKISGPPTEPYVVRKQSAPPITALPPLSPLIAPKQWSPPANPDLTGTVLEK